MTMQLLLQLPDDTSMSAVHDALLPLKLAGTDIRMFVNLDDFANPPEEPTRPWINMVFTMRGDKARQLKNISKILS